MVLTHFFAVKGKVLGVDYVNFATLLFELLSALDLFVDFVFFFSSFFVALAASASDHVFLALLELSDFVLRNLAVKFRVEFVESRHIFEQLLACFVSKIKLVFRTARVASRPKVLFLDFHPQFRVLALGAEHVLVDELVEQFVEML